MDTLVGNRLYLRLAWDNTPADFTHFAAQAVAAGGTGPYLDAGCGSLLFTGRLYRAALARPAVLVDQSVGMLRQARQKLASPDGRLPSTITLLHADLLDLPFAPGCFTSVLGMGLLHLFPDPAPLVRRLAAQLAPGAPLFLTSLVRAGRPIGDRYLAMLERSGQVATPRTAAQTLAALQGIAGRWRLARRGNTQFLVLGDGG